MDNAANYAEINRELWNSRLEVHLGSTLYDMEGFLKGNSSLNDIELALLGDIKGKELLHLQCHFGQDTISLARMGASTTGVDLSDKCVEEARKLAEKTGADASFICCNIYDLPSHSTNQYDIVFTSYGTIGWLPDMDAWAKIIANSLKPGGRFIFVDFHPVVWMFDDDFKEVKYNYFKDAPIVETQSGTYADRDADIQLKSVGWNHSISEVLTALLMHGLEIKSFHEYDYSPYNVFNNMVQTGEKRYRLESMDNKLPMVYAVTAVKK